MVASLIDNLFQMYFLYLKTILLEVNFSIRHLYYFFSINRVFGDFKMIFKNNWLFKQIRSFVSFFKIESYYPNGRVQLSAVSVWTERYFLCEWSSLDRTGDL